MKKFFSMMVALAAVVSFTACEKKSGDDPKPAPTPEKEQLATPELAVENVTATGFTVTWATVENAASYTVLLDGANSQNVTETSVTFEGLIGGEHTVGVKAMAAAGSNYSDSAMATIKQTLEGSTDWFSQEVFTQRIPEKGIFECNCVFIKWTGSNIKSIKYALLDGSKSSSYSDEEIMSLMEFAEGDWVEDINANGSIELNIAAAPNTNAEVAVYATDKNGQTMMLRNSVITDDAMATLDDYVGTYVATFNKQLVWAEGSDNTVNPSINACDPYTYTLEVMPYEGNEGYLLIYGLSHMADMPALAMVDEAGLLYILNYVQVGDADEDGYTPYWLAMTEDLGLVGTDVGYFAYPNEEDVIQAVGYSGAMQDGSKFTVAHLGIYGVAGNSVTIYAEEFPLTLFAGNFTMTKEAPSVARAAASFKSFEYTGTSRVVNASVRF